MFRDARICKAHSPLSVIMDDQAHMGMLHEHLTFEGADLQDLRLSQGIVCRIKLQMPFQALPMHIASGSPVLSFLSVYLA